jgi:3-phosphoshikimate 1-carboxyvinyltransferase
MIAVSRAGEPIRGVGWIPRIACPAQVVTMKLICHKSTLRGSVEIPGSKSHTIRAIAIATLASGDSRIWQPLDSEDTKAAVRAYRALGANIDTNEAACWKVRGTGGDLRAPHDVVDVGNSGTTMNIVMGSASLLRDGLAVFTGDAQIRRRPVGPVVQALNALGARVESTRDNGCPPIVVRGPIRGGETTMEAFSSQYLTSVLMCTPLAVNDSLIHVSLLHEQPYVEMTLQWLRLHGIVIEHEEMKAFRVPGGQQYGTVDRRIPGDFSSATFFLGAGALGDNHVLSLGLDMEDTQGDRAVIDYLRQMGAQVDIQGDQVGIKGNGLTGCDLDLNATPDALPMMAVLGCFAQGTTRLLNVPQARVKETDRISVMRGELAKLGARVEELEDGLVIHGSRLRGADVDGHDDHRVVMALAIAGTHIAGTTTIHKAQAAAVTYPGFVQALLDLHGAVLIEEE